MTFKHILAMQQFLHTVLMQYGQTPNTDNIYNKVTIRTRVRLWKSYILTQVRLLKILVNGIETRRNDGIFTCGEQGDRWWGTQIDFVWAMSHCTIVLVKEVAWMLPEDSVNIVCAEKLWNLSKQCPLIYTYLVHVISCPNSVPRSVIQTELGWYNIILHQNFQSAAHQGRDDFRLCTEQFSGIKSACIEVKQICVMSLCSHLQLTSKLYCRRLYFSIRSSTSFTCRNGIRKKF